MICLLIFLNFLDKGQHEVPHGLAGNFYIVIYDDKVESSLSVDVLHVGSGCGESSLKLKAI